MNKLVEVEMDSQAAAKQVAALKDIVRRLREVRVEKYIVKLEMLVAIIFGGFENITI